MDKDFYNKSSADSLGWDPTWFDADEFDEELVKNVKKWQKKMEKENLYLKYHY